MPWFADDHALVRHRRHIGAARRAAPHHAGDLRQPFGRHLRLIVEDPPEMVAVGEDLGLVRQVRAAAVDQIDARQPVLQRDLLRAQMLLHRHRIISAALHRRVVADDHRLAPRHAADPGDHPRPRDLLLVHVAGGELADLEEWRARIEQPLHALPRQQLAARHMPLAMLLRPALGRGGDPLAKLVGERAIMRGISAETTLSPRRAWRSAPSRPHLPSPLWGGDRGVGVRGTAARGPEGPHPPPYPPPQGGREFIADRAEPHAAPSSAWSGFLRIK